MFHPLKKNKILISILIVFFLLVGIIAGAIFYIKDSLKPTKAFLNGELCKEGESNCEITPFIVEEGAYGKSTIVKLQKEGIIKM